MKRSVKRILPILLGILIICSVIWYLGVYDREFTQDILLSQARFFDSHGNHNVAAWFYDLAYQQSNQDEAVAIELAEKFKASGNFTKAEYTLSNAIADGGSVDLYIALCKTYVQQNKLLDAVTMLENVSDPAIKEQLEALRPQVPTVSPAPGFYSQYITVSVTSTSGTLYVTADKTYPSTADAPYTQPIQLVGGENTVYALAVGENGLVSKLGVFGYVVGGVVEEVTLSDSAIDSMVRQMLGKSPEDKLSSADLWTITSATMPAEAVNYTDLQYLPYLEKLTIENGNFEDLTSLSSLSYLSELTIRGSILSSADISAIAKLPGLRKLIMENCGLSSIANLAAAQNIKELDLSNNTLRDIGVLASMSTLEKLDLSHNALTDVSQLSGLTNLIELNVSYNSLASLVPLADCTSLSVLDASHNTISSLSGLEALKTLTQLSVAYNDLTDVSLISGCTAMTVLNVSHNALPDISSLSGLSSLTELDFSNNQVSALPAFSAESALVTITGSYNKISAVDALAGLHQLNNVIMEYNNIATVDALASCHNLIKVNVFGNPVKDVSALTAQSIIVYYTPV